MRSRVKSLAVVTMVVVALVGFVLAVPIIPFQRTQTPCPGDSCGNPPVFVNVTCNCLQQITIPITNRGSLSVSDFLFGYGGRVVNGTYYFGKLPFIWYIPADS